ncbi:MAG TPA: RluA family pseudouridine synthase [Candidatus Eisenbacteria bacterium]|nr:RluA family pseudouridine synthase [Candidatus Eisenbacteria bacterium]
MTAPEGAVVRTYPRERVKSADFYIDTRFGILHEDADFLAVDKPAPLAVHPVGSYFDLNLHTLLKKDPRWADAKLHFTHRLDAETSGVVLLAKTHEAARHAGIEFMNGRVKKKYHALVFGETRDAEGEIDIPLGRDHCSGFQTVRIPDPDAGEWACTRWRRLWSRGGYSWLEVEPLSGRTHQIRAHLSFIGHPIVGDKIYIDLAIFQKYVVHGMDPEMLSRLKLRRLALHATSLSMARPGGEEMAFRSEPPDFMGQILP